jgi:probable rRNA maturation factor
MKKFINITYEQINDEKKVKINDIKKWMNLIFKELKLSSYSCSISFLSLKKIQKYNKDYLKKNYPTDVLSFSQITGENADFINSKFLGDIIISISYVEKNNLKNKKHPLNLEIKYLLLHAVLHLIGYDHEDDNNDGKMLNLQNKIFKRLTGVNIE